MSKLALAYLTKDKVDLSRRTIAPLIGAGCATTANPPFDLWWIDGSDTGEGQGFMGEIAQQFPTAHAPQVRTNVRGGPDAAVCYAFTEMLASPRNYEYVGICEQDVLLPQDWYGPTIQLFDRGAVEGLSVGAISARCYEDRILVQRDGYAAMHNLGFGHIIMTREAARLWLTNWRTGITTENRRVFAQLCGKDIGKWWAFRVQEHFLCSDWQLDKTLAAHGLASLALTPTDVRMIGQSPPLAEQGLALAHRPVELLRDDKAFDRFAENLRRIRCGGWLTAADKFMYDTSAGTWTIFPHQLDSLGAEFAVGWRLKWTMGFGPFSYRADAAPCSISIPISGPCEILCSGGETGGQIIVEDTQTGYRAEPHLPPETAAQVVALPIPIVVGYRTVVVTARSPGVIFYGIRVREPQPWLPQISFDHNTLPPV